MNEEKSVTKKMLIDELYRELKHEVSRQQVRFVVDEFLDLIIEHTGNGEEVRLNGFGTFKPITRKATRGTSPSTHEIIDIPEQKTIRLKLTRRYKEFLNEKE